MCFSAEASFTVGTVLCAIGIATLVRVKTRSHKLIASIPLLFGTHQIIEGFVWLSMPETAPNTRAVLLFLILAWVVWPTFVPLAFLVAEKKPWKRTLFTICLMIGLAISALDIRFLAANEVTPQIFGNSLYYEHSPSYGNYIYYTITLIPIFLSSIAGMWAFALMLTASFLAAQMIYFYTFTSVWCFFNAALSIALYKILREAEQKTAPKSSFLL